MTDRPELHLAIERSPLLPDAALRRHWQRVLPLLPDSLSSELEAVLRTAEGERLEEPAVSIAPRPANGILTTSGTPMGLMCRDPWLAAAGPWWRWGLYLPLIAPWPPDDFGASFFTRDGASEAVGSLAELLSERLRETPTLVVLDLDPILGLRVATSLAEAGLAHPVPFLPRWPYAEAVLPTGELLAALAYLAGRLPDDLHAGSVVMALDSGRNLPIPSRPWSDPRTDNRGEIAGDDLPNVAALQAAGITKVIDVRVAGESIPVPFRRFAYEPYERAGISVESLEAP